MVFYERDKASEQMVGNSRKALLPNEKLQGTLHANYFYYQLNKIAFIIS